MLSDFYHLEYLCDQESKGKNTLAFKHESDKLTISHLSVDNLLAMNSI